MEDRGGEGRGGQAKDLKGRSYSENGLVGKKHVCNRGGEDYSADSKKPRAS